VAARVATSTPVPDAPGGSAVPVQVPPAGVAGGEGAVRVGAWYASPGAEVSAGDPLVEVESAATVLLLAAPASGHLARVLVPAGEQAGPGAVLAELAVAPASRAVHREDLIDRIAAAEDPERESLRVLVDVLHAQDPALAEAVRRGAVARVLTQDVLALLTGAEQAEARRLLEELATLPFARRRPDGSVTFDHTTRSALLEEWRISGRGEEVRQLHRVLMNHYGAAQEEVRRLECDLRSVAPVVRAVDPARYAQLAGRVGARARDTLTELLHHAAAISAEGLYEAFEVHAEDYLARGQLLLCQWLTSTTRQLLAEDGDQPEATAAGRDAAASWLDFWDARLHRELDEQEEAERRLTDLLERVTETRLRLWTLSDLGALRWQQDRFREAAELYREEIALARRTGVDPWNLSTSYAALAGVELEMGDGTAAVAHYQEALHCAQKLTRPNQLAELRTWTALAKALHRLGRSEEAVAAALTAVALTRSCPGVQDGDHTAALSLAFTVLNSLDPRPAASLRTEAEAVTTGFGDRPRASSLRLEHINALADAGALDEARRLLGELTPIGGDDELRGLEAARELVTAIVAMHTASWDQARTSLDAALAAPGATRWERLAALSNRGLLHKLCGRWADSERDLSEALEGWQEVGSTPVTGEVRTELADVHRRQGRLAEAEELLDAARSELVNCGTVAEANLHLADARLRSIQGRLPEAVAAAREALEGHLTHGFLRDAAVAALALAGDLVTSGRLVEAAQAGRRAAAIAAELAERNQWAPTQRQRRADETAALAARALAGGGADPTAAAHRAHTLYVSAAGADPQNPWFQVGLALSDARLGRFDAAADELAAAERSWPAAASWLRERRADQEVAALEARGLPRERRTLDVLAAAVTVLSGHTPWRRRVAVSIGHGDLLWAVRRLGDEAGTAYRAALELARHFNGAGEEVAALARLAVLQAERGSAASEVVELLRDTFSAGRRMDAREVARTVREAATALAVQDRGRDVLGAALALVEETAQPALRPAALRARLALSLPATASEDVVAPVRVLALTADATLFPAAGATPGVVRLLQERIPAVREEMLARTGVRLPPVRLRAGADLRNGDYVVSWRDAVLATGQVVDGAVFDPAGGGGCRTATDPVSGRRGSWRPVAGTGVAPASGAAALDPYEFMLRHAVALVRADLPAVVGVDELERIVRETDPEAWPGTLTADDVVRLRLLAGVLRALVAEDVPVTHPEAVLGCLAGLSPSVSLEDAVDAVRRASRDDLPGHRGVPFWIGLPQPAEEALASAPTLEPGGSRLPAEQLPAGVREAVVTAAERARAVGVPLVVRAPRVRSRVHPLLGPAFRGLPVLSEEEIRPDPPGDGGGRR
jgi:tetratricopeptide (TPR) repeat protein